MGQQHDSGKSIPPTKVRHLSEGVRSALRTGVGLARLFSLLLAIFFLIFAPFAIWDTYDAWSWEPRKVRIISSEIVFIPGDNDKSGGNSLKIALLDLADHETSSNVQVRYGDFSYELHLPWRPTISKKQDDLARYPSGKEWIAFRDPRPRKHRRYVLEQNSILLMVGIWLVSLAWIGANAYLIHRKIATASSRTQQRETE